MMAMHGKSVLVALTRAPATTEVLKLNTYMGMTGQPFVRALYFQSAKKIIGKKSRMQLITRKIQ